MSVPEGLTVPEVMAALRLSRSTVYDLIRSRELESFKVRRCRRIAPESLRAYRDKQIEENAA
ncbi:helix-turn-helix domain-containing protein [Streptantibioticus rubrisoli]|uniref:Helix-turn-helix domain-containing protein n=1 Tax=Streptantibioticus rubrisoli TaxID=1387313 RepID=A0ABT1PIL9_9ACTN|nr:helix-turn-helix domain-containing protein [Streptantibioticus rubrisoli]MCQ4044641.1 helix-turn-helix domain-containing protein [Streptantibioticus rubrisoli]